MYVVVKQNCYGYEFGSYSVSKIFGPFDNEDDARAFANKQPTQYGTEFAVEKVTPVL